jgi:transcriptional regulator with XRE-family HTH domain
MDSQRLGDLLRRLRKQATITQQEFALGHKRLTQELLAYRLGWQTAAQVSQIENGQRRPEAYTLERILEQLNVSVADHYLAYGLAGYLPSTRWPQTDTLINHLDSIIGQAASAYPFPFYVLDYRNYFWGCSFSFVKLFLDKTNLTKEFHRPLNLFHCLFDRALPFVNYIQQLDDLRRDLLCRFHAINIQRQHEPDINQLPQLLSQTIPHAADRDELHQFWQETRAVESISLTQEHEATINFDLGDMLCVRLRYIVEPIYQLNNLFHIVHFFPQTSDAAYNWHADNYPPVKVWDYIVPEDIISPTAKQLS